MDRVTLRAKKFMAIHIPVMASEILQWLQPESGKLFVDGTLGAGGHTRLLAERVGNTGRVISLDRDPAAVAAAEIALRGLPIAVANASYREFPQILDELSLTHVDGILLDLGLSSDQLADDQRGFSFAASGLLDMRFNPEEGEPAWALLDRIREEDLANLIFQYGEERCSRRIAKAVVETRRQHPLRTAEDLAKLVRRCVPRSADRIDPATRTFQALRIAVNGELKELEVFLQVAAERLKRGGRLAILSFHSLEDRLVKEAFRGDERLQVLTKKPLMATAEENARNPRARSAKLRVAERV
jgi:16S rRNA (cytosine1402-N4)-methyltransferase